MKKKLTHKQKRFCLEYLVDKNSTAAAIRAGYSKKTAQVIGPENLAKPLIAQHLDFEIEKQEERTKVTADWVILELAKLASINSQDIFNDGGKLINIKKLPRKVAAAISSVEVVKQTTKEGEPVEFLHKIKFWDKKGALDTLAKHFGLLLDKIKISGDINISFADRLKTGRDRVNNASRFDTNILSKN